MATLKRFFGVKRPDVHSDFTLRETADLMGKRDSVLSEKLAAVEAELGECRAQLGRRGVSPDVRQSVRRRALRALQSKKMYETQRDALAQQHFNVEQAAFGVDCAKDTVVVVGAMTEAAAAMRTQLDKIDVAEVEDTMDDLEDLLEQNADIQASLGRSYGVELDDDDLDAELDALGTDLDYDFERDEPPGYLNTVAAGPAPSPATLADFGSTSPTHSGTVLSTALDG